MLRKVKRLGLQTLFDNDKNFRKGVKKIIALPLLPPQDIPAGFEEVKKHFQDCNLQVEAAPLLT